MEKYRNKIDDDESTGSQERDGGHSPTIQIILETLLDLSRRLERMEIVLNKLVEKKAEKQWYSTKELAEATGKSLFTVTQHWCNEGRIECVKNQDTNLWQIPVQEFKRLVNGGGLLPKK